MSPRHRLLPTPWMLWISLSLAGCGLVRPNLQQPGHLYQQQLRASYYDPFGDTVSAPEFGGSRPRDYDAQRSQPTRSQRFREKALPFPQLWATP
jgi:hypothetical protein